jgi:hypothetical protein
LSKRVRPLASIGVGVLDEAPAVAQEAVVIDAGALAAEVVGRSVLEVALELLAVADDVVAVAIIEPVAGGSGEEAAAVPAVALAEQDERAQPRGPGDRGPRAAERPAEAAVHGEVDQVAAVGGEVAAALVDPAAQPLALFKGVPLAVPRDQAHLFGRAAAEHDGPRAALREQDVQARWEGGVAHGAAELITAVISPNSRRMGVWGHVDGRP